MTKNWRERQDGNQPLEAWEVMAEEFEKAGNNLGGTLDDLATDYFDARQRYDDAQKGKFSHDPTPKHETRNNRDLRHARLREETKIAAEQARKRIEDALFRHFHTQSRTALCFSGGGVRSATFGLGILHGLAKINPSLLPQFDFLSTVSGGGYLGAWFSCWAAREEKEAGPSSASGAERVAERLAAIPTSTLDPEPAELLHIRKYCRFLNPKLGLLSADTWSLVATVARNMILNWLILIPLLMALLVIPLLYESAANHRVSATGTNVVLWIGFLTGVIGAAYSVYRLPSFSGAKAGGDLEYFFLALLPLVISAVALSMHWIWRQSQDPAAGNYTWSRFSSFGLAMALGGSLVGVFLLGLIRRRWSFSFTVLGLVAAGLSGGLAGWLVYIASNLFIVFSESWHLYACLSIPIVLLAFAIAVMLAVGLASEITSDEDREWWSRAGGWILIVTAGWLIFSMAVLYVPIWLTTGYQIVTTAGATAGIGALASRLGFSSSTLAGRRAGDKSASGNESGGVKDIIAKLAGPLFLLLLIALLGMVDKTLVDGAEGWFNIADPLLRELLVGISLLVLGLVCSFWINVNRFSLHAMYRARLIRTYLGASTPNREQATNRFTDFNDADNLAMSRLSQHRPLHIVNMALNLVGGKNLAWQQRKAESFTSSRLRTGSLRLGYQKTDAYGRPDGSKQGLTLGSAITISGAAASPNMGYHSSPLLSLVMTLFNARLGWWLANPGPHGKGKWTKDGPTFSFKPLMDEALGRTDDESTWVYLSDGGHFENLAIYEMVLRRCRTIVVVDGSQDVTYTCEDLGNAVRKVRVDLGIQIDFKPGLPIHSARDARNRYCAVGTIRYNCVDGADAPDGKLLYIKACLNGTEPVDVLHYASFDPIFPQQGTEQLWFDESQFESYRRLGAHIIEQISDKDSLATVESLVAKAEAYIGSTPKVRLVGWPKVPQFTGALTGTLTGAELSMSLNLDQS